MGWSGSTDMQDITGFHQSVGTESKALQTPFIGKLAAILRIGRVDTGKLRIDTENTYQCLIMKTGGKTAAQYPGTNRFLIHLRYLHFF